MQLKFVKSKNLGLTLLNKMKKWVILRLLDKSEKDIPRAVLRALKHFIFYNFVLLLWVYG